MTTLGRLELHAGDLDLLVDLLADRIAERFDLGATGGWYTPQQYHDNGWSPSVEAARKRAYRLLERGSADAKRTGRRVWLRGPSNGSPGAGPGGETDR